MIGRIVLVVLSLMFISCIEQIGQFKGGKTPLIIEGVITDESGPHVVKVLKRLGFNEKPDFDEFSNAIVHVEDESGSVEPFSYTELGKFQSSADFKARVGGSYKLSVELADGTKYESEVETLSFVPNIDSLWYQEINSNINFYINFEDEPNIRNYYRWRFDGTYEVHADMARYVVYEGAMPSIENQLRCYPLDYLHERKEFCWMTDYDNEFLLIEDDFLYRNARKTGFQVYSIPVDDKLNYGYSAGVIQESLSQSAYEYWSAIKTQQGNTGTIFETSNYQIVGNIYNVDDPDELVLGFFGASSVRSKRVYIGEYENRFSPRICQLNQDNCYPLECVNCIAHGPSATPAKPEYWPD